LLDYGADDYVEKSFGFCMIAPRAISVWRRTLLAKPSKRAHFGRTFLLGSWRFTIGDRTVTDSKGASKRLSITEHAFLRYLCAVDDHAINSEIFNIEVLGRDPHETHVRLDVFVPRLREKFDNTIELPSQGRSGFYRLLDVQEVKPRF
jgi:DNA-binding response OmpR family regulator